MCGINHIIFNSNPGSVDTDVMPGDSSQDEPAEVWKFVCAHVCQASGLNSPPKARHFNMFREALMCQTRQNGFGQNHIFFVKYP